MNLTVYLVSGKPTQRGITSSDFKTVIYLFIPQRIYLKEKKSYVYSNHSVSSESIQFILCDKTNE